MRDATEAIASVAERLVPLPVLACGAGFGIDAADVRELRGGGRGRDRRRRGGGGDLGRADRRRAGRGRARRRTACRCSPACATASTPRSASRSARSPCRCRGRGPMRRGLDREAPRRGVGDGRARRLAAHARASAPRGLAKAVPLTRPGPANRAKGDVTPTSTQPGDLASARPPCTQIIDYLSSARGVERAEARRRDGRDRGGPGGVPRVGRVPDRVAGGGEGPLLDLRRPPYSQPGVADVLRHRRLVADVRPHVPALRHAVRV